MSRISKRSSASEPLRRPEAGRVSRALPELAARQWRWLKANRLLTSVAIVVLATGVWSLLAIVRAIPAAPPLPETWRTQIALFFAVATVPQVVISVVARIAEALAQIPRRSDKWWLRNPGALVGIVERPLYLGSLIAGQPGFIGVWFILKGVAGYKIGFAHNPRIERRLFQLFLLNNAISLGLAALGWVIWKFVLRFPTWPL